jgi:pseudouridine synthase
MRPSATLERFLSKAGAGSRSEAREWIAAGRVAVNGTIARQPLRRVDPERDRVTLDGREIRPAGKIYLLLHKPKGYVTTRRDPEGRPTVFDLIPGDRRGAAGPAAPYLFPVGRLDRDTSGLLLLTNDSAFAERVADPRHKVPKTYQVKASTRLSGEQLDRLRRGILLKDGPTRPAQVTRLRDPGGKTVFEITITEGRNRQVRRMVEALGGKVIRLERTAIGPLRLGSLPPGHSRPLMPEEIHGLGEEWR